MQKFKNSKKTLDETPHLNNWVSKADTPEELSDLIEDENEKVSKKVKKQENTKAPSYQDLRPYNKES
ncbi:hypothetical protein CHF27_003760 [Romboutsia maritimum]|uniref:Uncharacterized protein n=1 Tax=Romboutsia maritimum TaxID=2020948 RepID=A0A371IUP9_9FIRM|nr:hypothetical protein [Romboutsia maritimum]RDY24204.1 hypothetical protein CHF27_003760 [Romboutsia maritimum]